MTTPLRLRAVQTLTVIIAGALLASALPSAATAATYPSDTTPPDLVEILGGYDDIWTYDRGGALHGTVNDPASAAHNDEMTVWVNNHATTQQQLNALQDANYDTALLVATGLGSRLQPLYLEGMQSGSLPRTRALMSSMAAYANTDPLKAVFGYPRPFLATDPATTGAACDASTWNGSSLAGVRVGAPYADEKGNLDIRQVGEMTDASGVFGGTRTVGVGYGGYCASASFPSGHTTNSYLSGLTLATLLPELAPGILARVSEMGTNRIVLGMHYPLDVIGGRIAGSAEVAERWADTAYRRDVIEPARAELRAYLERCGDTIAACAAAGTAYANDPFAGAVAPGGTAQRVTDTASALAVYRERLTYGFAQTGARDLAPAVPATAAALLRSSFPTLTDAQRTAVLAQTEIASGSPLDRTAEGAGSWQRLDLAAAMTASVRLSADGTATVTATGGTPKVVPADGMPLMTAPDGTSVEVESALAIAAAGLSPATDYRAVFADDSDHVLATIRSDAAGGLAGSLTIAADTRVGDRTLQLRDASGSVVASLGVTIVAKPVYTIAAEADLEQLRAHPDGTFELTADIAMTRTWTPVPVFGGELRGNGHTITGLRIETTGNQGLVITNNGTIARLGFLDAVSTNLAQASAGIVAGINNGTVDQVYVVNGTVTGAHRSGLVVANNWGTVSNSYSTGHASGQWETGGITAWNDSSARVTNNYSTATVTAAYANVGVIAGVGNGGSVFTGNVARAGAVQGMSGNAARVVGVGNPTLRDNLALDTIPVNGRTVAGGSADDLQGAPRSVDRVQDAATYAALGWDFDTTWAWDDGRARPVLRAVAERGTPRAVDAADVPTLMASAVSQLRNNLLSDALTSADRMGDDTGRAWKTLLNDWDAAHTAMRIHDSVPADLPRSGHVFVLLGYALNDDGTARPELIGRLQQAKAGLDAYPDSRIVVTGGVVRSGQTEAGVMRAWLLDHGVSADRIIFENAATDTPTNAINTMALLSGDPSITSYTLVSSASHLRRATVVFEAAALAAALRYGSAPSPASVGNIAFLDTTTAANPPSASERDQIAQNVAKVWSVSVEFDSYSALLRNITGRLVFDQRTGDPVDALRQLELVSTRSAAYADRLAELAARWNEALALTSFRTETPDVPRTGHTFIVPGSALNGDGSLTETSLARLRVAVQALAAHPYSTVTVVGGAAVNGVTEAGAQRAWLLANGVPDARIVVVDTSSSLVQGAQHSMVALSARGTTDYTVITSASVLRRTLAVYTAGATYAASQSASGAVLRPLSHIAIMDDAAAQNPADENTRRVIAENIADVLGVRSEYNAWAASPPAAPALERLDVTGPVKKAYLVGDALDTAGLSARAAYADGTSVEVVSLATLSGFDASATGEQTVTVSFTDRGVTRTGAFSVSVRRADAGSLQEAIDRAAAIDPRGYTADSARALADALDAARAAVADLDADAEKLAGARTRLQGAVDGLVAIVPVPDPTDASATAPAPAPADAPAGGLAATGGGIAAGVLASGIVLLLAGAAVVTTRRRRATR